MKFFGFDITLHVRRADPPLPKRLYIPLVRLTGGDYSVPAGTVGVVDSTDEEAQQHFVCWSTGGCSGPINDVDLERLGEVSVPIEAPG